MPRPRKLRRIGWQPIATVFKPQGIPLHQLRSVFLPVEGMEALRLADAKGLEHDEAAQRMGVSRPTFSRLLAEARRVVASALAEGWAVRIEGGTFETVPQQEVPTGRRRGPFPAMTLTPAKGLNMSNTIIAIPSAAPGGLEAKVFPHFGHCPVYTLVTLTENGVEKTEVMEGVPHDHGGCLAPIEHLKRAGVGAMVASGIGRRPLMGFHDAEILVFHSGECETVGDVVYALLAGRLPMFDVTQTCGGGAECDHGSDDECGHA